MPCRHTSGVWLDQEWQVKTGNRWRTGRSLIFCESDGRERRLNRPRRGGCDQIWSGRGLVRRFGRHKLLAARNRAFAAIVRIRGAVAFALLAAVGGLLREWSAAEAVERLQEQEDGDEADGDVNAATHSLLNDTRLRNRATVLPKLEEQARGLVPSCRQWPRLPYGLRNTLCNKPVSLA